MTSELENTDNNKEVIMSIRCQVQVIQEGLSWEERVSLYLHDPGCPSYIIPVMRQAYRYQREKYWDQEPDENTFNWWRKGRPRKVASYLCWAAPGIFEPLDYHDIHPDINYYYRLYCVNNDQAGDVVWEVEVFILGESSRDLRLIQPRTRLEDIDLEKLEESYARVKREMYGFEYAEDVVALNLKRGIICRNCWTDEDEDAVKANKVITYKDLVRSERTYICDDCEDVILPSHAVMKGYFLIPSTENGLQPRQKQKKRKRKPRLVKS
jgi:hypothetical protein